MPYYFAGDYDAAKQQLQRTLDLNDYWLPRMLMGRVLTQEKKYMDAVEQQKKAGLVSYEPLSHLGYVQAITGHRAEAQRTLQQLLAMGQKHFVQPSDVARIYAGLGEKNSAFEWLRRGAQEKEYNLILLNIDPEFASLCSDPRFRDLVRQIGLAQ